MNLGSSLKIKTVNLIWIIIVEFKSSEYFWNLTQTIRILTVEVESGEDFLGSLYWIKLLAISLTSNFHMLTNGVGLKHYWYKPPKIVILTAGHFTSNNWTDSPPSSSFPPFTSETLHIYLWLAKVISYALQDINFVLIALIIVLNSAGDQFHRFSSFLLLWRICQSLFRPLQSLLLLRVHLCNLKKMSFIWFFLKEADLILFLVHIFAGLFVCSFVYIICLLVCVLFVLFCFKRSQPYSSPRTYLRVLSSSPSHVVSPVAKPCRVRF